MPHINLLYPFVEDDRNSKNFDYAAGRMEDLIKRNQFKSFSVIFNKDSFNYFEHRLHCTLWLKPFSEAGFLYGFLIPINVFNLCDFIYTYVILYIYLFIYICTFNIIYIYIYLFLYILYFIYIYTKVTITLGEVNADILRLQQHLQEEFPDFDDLHKVSEGGFKPHLSLGQFSRGEIENEKSLIRDSWDTLKFTVNEVCIISRINFESPFEVRHRIKLL